MPYSETPEHETATANMPHWLRQSIRSLNRYVWLVLLITHFTPIASAESLETIKHDNKIRTCQSVPHSPRSQFPKNTFSKCAIPFGEFRSGGPPRDGIPSIDSPRFGTYSSNKNIANNEPVIVVSVNDITKVYPLRILTWHEIVNDELGGVPLAVTYCPLCNASIVFERRFDAQLLDFGTTGRLRKSDLVMYDRQSETWWQQYSGQGLVGKYAGDKLKVLPSRVVSYSHARRMYPKAQVLEAPTGSLRPYGNNPYVGYDSSPFPFLFDGSVPDGVKPMSRVVIIGAKAWSFEFLRKQGVVIDGDLKIQWRSGLASALDTSSIANGRDVGTVQVRKRDASGTWQDTTYKVSFAFVFFAFNPDGELVGLETIS